METTTATKKRQMPWEIMGYQVNPFDRRPDERFMFDFAQHKAARADLEYTVHTQGFSVFTGDIGSGKTTVLRALLDKLDLSEIKPCFIRVRSPHITSHSLHQDMVERLGEEPPKWGRHKVENQLERVLRRLYEEGRLPLLIIDEAQGLRKEALETVRLLSDYAVQFRGIISIILVGQPELRYRLLSAQYRNLAQRVTVFSELNGLVPSETDKYVRYRLTQAGGNPSLFSAPAIELIHRKTDGTPRTINRLCEDCIAYGAMLGEKQITKDFAEAVAAKNPLFASKTRV